MLLGICCLTSVFQGLKELPQRVLAHTSVCFVHDFNELSLLQLYDKYVIQL